MVDRDKLLAEERVRLGPAVVEGLRVLRTHAVGLLLLTFLPALAVELAFGYVQARDPDFQQTGALTGMDAVWSVITREWNYPALALFVTVVPLVAGTVAILTVATEVDREVSVGAAVRGVLRRALRLLSVTVALLAAVAVVIGLAIVVDGIVPNPLPAGSISDVFSAMVLAAGLIVLTAFALAAYPVAVSEDGGPVEAVTRTVELTLKRFSVWLGRAFAIALLAAVLAAAVRFVVMQIVRMIEKGVMVEAIGEAVADTVAIPLFAAAAAMTYLDIRGREGPVDADDVRRQLPV